MSTSKAFLHFIFENENPGFVLAKEVLGALQRRRFPVVGPIDVAKGLGGVLGLAFSRYLRFSLYIPGDTRIHLQLDMEQTPEAQNRIILGAERDKYGRLLPRIRWRICDEDLKQLNLLAQRAVTAWPNGKGGVPILVPRQDGCSAFKPHDAYHPVGTCRLGDDSAAVVNTDLKVRGLCNVWLISTAVLPSAGTANPTFSVLCLAHSLAQQLNSARYGR
jgi:hypothetical protein